MFTGGLAAIFLMTALTDFGFIYNGATEEERAKVVAAWREFVAKTPPGKLCTSF